MTHYTKTIDHTVVWDAPQRTSKFAVIARLVFGIYLFFVIFGTSLPFQDPISDAADIATSNIINQIVFGLLFLISAVTLIPKRREMVSLIKKEKFFSLFLLWCLLSVFWSDFRFVSFKRLVQIFTTVFVSLSVLFYTPDSEDLLKYFKSILYVYILLSIVSVLTVSGAIDPQTQIWRGLAPSKNHLGQSALISALVWLAALRLETTGNRVVSFLMLMLSLILLIGSQSITAIITLLVLAMTRLVFSLDNRFGTLGIGRLFSVLVMTISLMLAILILYAAPEIILSIPGYLGKDITFTGRTDLWAEIFKEASEHLPIGCGFAGFWVQDNINILILYEDYVWLPRQAHLGYLDILNETGLVGLMLFAAMVIFYLKGLLSLDKPHVWKWFLFATLIINFQETTLFRPNILTGVMFIFAYLALYSEIIKRERSVI